MSRILILDDDNISNELNKLVLNILGVTDIDIMTSGKEALQYLEECRQSNVFPSLMFVDINLPGMSGLDFVKEYEAHYMCYSPGTKIIILTNSVLDEDRDESVRFDSVVDFMSKPLNKKKIQEIFLKVNSEI